MTESSSKTKALLEGLPGPDKLMSSIFTAILVQSTMW
eukprot:CAMPEP_0170568428 /NCGR_PEP_ID=MMETSP0211-20121228/81190_1 /TAXON_ID=311385 /ORGANISM="Pseudokeronopsis sp., Strain OXSARD2" /LENGTH=36 /DNA_ID= /DNA_START= /DNA_END= /DNA_ORIENTATION=